MLITPLAHVVFKGVIPGIYKSYRVSQAQINDFEGGICRTYLPIKKGSFGLE
jgi:hypothetical protein